MGKLPSTILRRPSLATAAGYLPSTSPAAAAAAGLPHTPNSVPLPHGGGAAHQIRHATFVPRSRRPYQFTQLVQLSDGSTFTVRTTSPLALYKSAKDSRNHILWQPTEKSLRNVEVDEAGKLAAFRERYGTGWDLGAPATTTPAPDAAAATPAAAAPDAAAAVKQEEGAAAAKVDTPAAAKEGGETKAAGKGGKKVDAKQAAPTPAPAPAPAEAAAPADPFDSLTDLISSYATEDKNIKGGLSAKDQAKKEKKKK